MPEPPNPAPVSRTFVVVTFAAAIVIGVAIAYLGIRGTLGGGIP
ncbi:MAG TPA: hypothetical protein VLX64_01480 [Thermoplasmata archaeon]|nr:hypothetical protein [Thermoplasmata archaeon]